MLFMRAEGHVCHDQSLATWLLLKWILFVKPSNKNRVFVFLPSYFSGQIGPSNWLALHCMYKLSLIFSSECKPGFLHCLPIAFTSEPCRDGIGLEEDGGGVIGEEITNFISNSHWLERYNFIPIDSHFHKPDRGNLFFLPTYYPIYSSITQSEYKPRELILP